jgi:hypothetical protein
MQNPVGRSCAHEQTLIEPKFTPCQIFAHRHGQRLSNPETKMARNDFRAKRSFKLKHQPP